jgi:flagellar biosynthesis/type III secretory pathway protein FliH
MEFYVLYTGDRKDRPQTLSLSQEFFQGHPCALEVTVNMIYDGKQGDIVSQYVAFTRIYREQVQNYGRTKQAVLETIKICQNSKILEQYLESRKKEVITIMASLFNQEQALEAYLRDERREAEQKGLQRGLQKGLRTGKQEGRAELAQQVALTMYRNNNPVDVIAATVQESVATVKQWLGLD